MGCIVSLSSFCKECDMRESKSSKFKNLKDKVKKIKWEKAWNKLEKDLRNLNLIKKVG